MRDEGPFRVRVVSLKRSAPRRVELRLGDGAPRWHTILDGRNRPAGRVRLAARTAALPPSRVAASAEVTVVADTFCHLYVLAASAQEDLRRYMRAMRLPLAKRLPADARAVARMQLRDLKQRVNRALNAGGSLDTYTRAYLTEVGEHIDHALEAGLEVKLRGRG